MSQTPLDTRPELRDIRRNPAPPYFQRTGVHASRDKPSFHAAFARRDTKYRNKRHVSVESNAVVVEKTACEDAFNN